MNTLDIHGVKSIQIHPVKTAEVLPNCSWRTISITTDEGLVDIHCFPEAHPVQLQILSMRSGVPAITRPGANQTIVQLGDIKYFYSYDSFVAYCSPQRRVRIAPISRSTTRHMKAMGCWDFTEVSPSSFWLLTQE